MNGTDYTHKVSKFKLDFAKKKFENKGTVSKSKLENKR
jgi:hypothetical protein